MPRGQENQGSPNKVFELPMGAETGHLQNEDTIIIEQIIHLPHEGSIAADTNVLMNKLVQ
jgi:hypothetical protein